MSSSYRLELNRWLPQLDISCDHLLDIGGSQEPLKGRTKSWDVKEYKIADLPNPHKDSPKPDIELDLNRSFNINADGYMELSDGSHGKFGKDIYEKFDLIFCLEVFDYVFDPFTAFDNIKQMLKPGGTAWITFPSVYPLHQPIEDDALRYMPGGIRKLAESVGLTIEEMIPRRTETDAIYNAFRIERMRCAKHEDHNISGWIVKFRKL